MELSSAKLVAAAYPAVFPKAVAVLSRMPTMLFTRPLVISTVEALPITLPNPSPDELPPVHPLVVVLLRPVAAL